ncbi:hypothetical protein MRX96_008699 [Rhipicephalus microplus]
MSTTKSSLPPDGLCDLVFFDSFYQDNKNILANGFRRLEASARFFMRQARRARKMKYGASFAFTGISGAVQFNIHHFGFLNLYREFSKPAAMANALLVLKQLDFFVKRLPVLLRPLYVIGLSVDFAQDHKTVDLMRTIFVPSMFIAIGHISYSDASFPYCTILPPNVLTYPNSHSHRANKTYGHTLNDTIPILEMVRQSHPRLPMSISVGLSGRYYAPKFLDGPSRYLPFEDCTDFSGPRYDDPANVCPSVAGDEWKFEQNKNYHYEALLNEKLKKTFTFDSIDSLKLKLCDAKRYLTSVSFGVAAYDVDFDSSPEGCAEIGIKPGAFSRLSGVRRLSEFLLNDYNGYVGCQDRNFTRRRAP